VDTHELETADTVKHPTPGDLAAKYAAEVNITPAARVIADKHGCTPESAQSALNKGWIK
jgi:hypothetical protein